MNLPEYFTDKKASSRLYNKIGAMDNTLTLFQINEEQLKTLDETLHNACYNKELHGRYPKNQTARLSGKCTTTISSK